MAATLICGDFWEDGVRTTIIPFGRNEWEKIENLRAHAGSKGISIAVRRQDCYTTMDSSYSTVINQGGDVFNSGPL